MKAGVLGWEGGVDPSPQQMGLVELEREQESTQELPMEAQRVRAGPWMSTLPSLTTIPSTATCFSLAVRSERYCLLHLLYRTPRNVTAYAHAIMLLLARIGL